jgi:hypothetical protein
LTSDSSVAADLVRDPSFSLGRYTVCVSTRRTHSGYLATLALRSGQGMASHCRVWRFAPSFSSRDAARRYAVAESHQLAGACA